MGRIYCKGKSTWNVLVIMNLHQDLRMVVLRVVLHKFFTFDYFVFQLLIYTHTQDLVLNNQP